MQLLMTLILLPRVFLRIRSSYRPLSFVKFNPSNKLKMEQISKPNIVVFTDDDDGSFKKIEANILKCVHSEKYVIYKMTASQLLESPWRDSANLLILRSKNISSDVKKSLRTYADNGGKLLVFCSNFDHPKVGFGFKLVPESRGDISIGNFSLWRDEYRYISSNSQILFKDDKQNSVVIKASASKGFVIASEVDLFGISSTTHDSIDLLRTILNDHCGLERFVDSSKQPYSCFFISEKASGVSLPPIILEESTGEKISVPINMFDNSQEAVTFNQAAYFGNLKTKSLGRTVLFFPVVTTTMSPAAQLSDTPDIIIIARRQVSGKGRGDNVWLSPLGCAMFTVNLKLSLKSNLGQRLSILQHMMGLAVVRGIQSLPGMQNLGLRLKWPNDIYFGKNEKIGGILVTSSIMGYEVQAHIGCGINVSNERPTVCINSILKKLYPDKDPLSEDQVIAVTLNELEAMVKNCNDGGFDDILKSYYEFWVHKGQRVRVKSLDVEATVTGINDYGFLIVETDDKKIVTLQPDGNRFDMMENLIVAK